MNKKFFVLLISAFLIRLVSLNQSLWLDEATTARVVQQYNFAEIISKFSPSDFHPPLYYLFMKAWTNVFGYSEISLRMPSVIFSLLTGYTVYLLGKRMRNSSIGLWSSAFFLFNPLIIYYSQEARMYMMATFFLTTSLYYFFKLFYLENRLSFPQKRESRKNNYIDSHFHRNDSNSRNKFGMTKIAMFNLAISLSFLTFYGSIFLIFPMFLYLFYKKQYRFFIFSILFFTFSFIVIFPLLYQQFVNARQQLQLVPNWKNVLGNANLKNLLLIPLKFSIGRINFYPKWLYWGISGLWTSFVWLFVLKGGLKKKFLFFLVIGSLGSGILFSFFSPLLQYFRFIYLVPIFSMLMALGSAKFHRFGGKRLVLTGYLIFSAVYLLNPNFHREDWKSLAKAIPKNQPIYIVYSSSDPVRYYRDDIKIIDLKFLSEIKVSQQEIYVIPYTAEIHGINYQKKLAARKYKLDQLIVYRGVTLEKWKRYNTM